MSVETLRALSRAYAAGDIDRESYRLERRTLLGRIVAGEFPVIPFLAPEPESPTVFPDDDDEGDTTQEVIPGIAQLQTTTTSRQSGAPIIPIAIVIAVLAAGVIGWLATDSTGGPEPQPGSEPELAPRVDILLEFLEENSWAPERIVGLTREWSHLAPADRDEYVKSKSMRRFTDAVFEQITAESALIELGDAEEALDAQEQLLDLFDHLGVSNERVMRARQRWTETREEKLAVVSLEPPALAAAEAPAEVAVPDAPAAAEVLEAPPSKIETAPASEAVTAPPAKEETPLATAPAATRSAETAPPAAKSRTVRSNCKAELAKQRRPYCMDVLASGVKGPVMVVLPSGSFEMGGTRDEEIPRHTVIFEDPFAMGMFEISVAELNQYCENAGAKCPEQPWDNSALPAVNVSWDLARAFTDWLSEITGAEYRLPTEPEWEYATRAGTTTTYPFGEEIVPTDARYSFKSTETEPLATNDRSVNRNDFRLYHMLGNVREWMLDTWAPNYKGAPSDGSARSTPGVDEHVVRGGSYADRANALRSAARLPQTASRGDRYTGFRVVRVIN